MLRWETFVCMKCGCTFMKVVGGIVTTDREMNLRIHPVCDRCKWNSIIGFFKPQK